MSNLQEVLTLLLDAETEAEQIVGSAHNEAAEVLRKTQEQFARERTAELSAANERARAIIDASVADTSVADTKTANCCEACSAAEIAKAVSEIVQARAEAYIARAHQAASRTQASQTQVSRTQARRGGN